ncbi:hypothetical protein MMC30_008075 [Trapelia coarctata]|nr:hypothetical protein [Trapelia coarctata]
MSSWTAFEGILAAVPEHCTPQNHFLTSISSVFQSCIPTPLAFLSTLLGSLSILSWLFAQLPQIYKNYSLSSTSGLSIFFLVEWCLGDATNLCGALLTGQATWQVVVAGYYVSVDVVLVIQYFWYRHYKPWREVQQPDQSDSGSGWDSSSIASTIEGIPASDSSSTRPSTSDGKNGGEQTPTKPLAAPFNSFHFPAISSPREKGTPSSSYPTIHRIQRASTSPAPSPKTLLLISIVCAVLSNASPLQASYHPRTVAISVASNSDANYELLGRRLSWTSTLLYLGSRLPQLYKNHTRRSTTGLSPALFIAAFFGNLFYSSSLFTNPLAWSSYPPYGLHGWVGSEGSRRETWIALAAPFWLGAAGVLALDAAMGVQFLIFGEKEVVVKTGRRRHGRWRRVSGWMRGWVPSPIPRRARSAVVHERRGLISGEARVERAGQYGTV